MSKHSQIYLNVFPPSLTDHVLQFQKQVEEAGVADGHVWLCVSQSNQLHDQIIHNNACIRDHMQVRRNDFSGVMSRGSAGQCTSSSQAKDVMKICAVAPPGGHSELAAVDRWIALNRFQSGLVI